MKEKSNQKESVQLTESWWHLIHRASHSTSSCSLRILGILTMGLMKDSFNCFPIRFLFQWLSLSFDLHSRFQLGCYWRKVPREAEGVILPSVQTAHFILLREKWIAVFNNILWQCMNLPDPQKLSHTHLLFLQNPFISRFLNDSQMNVKPRHHLSFPHSPLSLIPVEPKFDLSHHIIHLSVIQAFYDSSLLQSTARNNFLYSAVFFFPFLLTFLHIGIMTPCIQKTSSF